MTTAMDDALGAAWHALGGAAGLPTRVRWSGPRDALVSRLPVLALARVTVAAYALAAAELAATRSGTASPIESVDIDAGAVATAFTSERQLRVNGRAFGSFAPLSRFWPATDGWVRTHGNYPHHRARLLAGLGIDAGTDSSTDSDAGTGPDGATGSDIGAGSRLVDAVAERIAALPRDTVAERVTAAGGLAVAVRTPQEWATHPQGRAVAGLPLLTLRQAGSTPVRRMPPVPTDPLRPAGGVRVLDLSRVIAGPVGTRSLALLGADVLRVDSPRLAEIEGQHLDTGFGKRSTLLDLDRHGDRAVFDELLREADVVVTGYRPGALDRFGLTGPALLERRPGLVVAELCAWGATGPWAGRRGFDSLVQAATGIAVLHEGPDGTPGALPAQALDHGTGYLLAAAVLRGLSSRAVRGGGWSARLSLAQTASWLLGSSLPGSSLPGFPPATGDHGPTGYHPDRWCAQTTSELGRLRYALPPVTLPGAAHTWAHPPGRWGADPPTWLG
jgi:crotonobetainyl-CoA:carnitine CoA-transferase CaiB-like acyl-CoA transferase